MRTYRLRGEVGVLVFCVASGAWGSVNLHLDADVTAPVEFGATELKQAIRDIGQTLGSSADADYRIVAGISGHDGAAERFLRAAQVTVPTAPEALTIQRMEVQGRPGLVLCGADERGLMYALLDTAERLRWAEDADDPLSAIRDARETPYLKDRTVSTYTMHPRYFQQRLLDEAYWQRYFAMLAKARINRFLIIFGYENGGFMAPAYPFFYDVEGFPDVEMVGVSAAQQARHTAAFNRLIAIAHDHGIQITPGFWDFIYRGRVQGGGVEGANDVVGRRFPYLVDGVTTGNLVAYNKAALRKFLATFPEIDSLHFRMHWESGLTREETPLFWHDMFALVRQARPDMPLDLRAKGLPDVVIEDAIEQGLNFRIATKFWMEQLGLPFHPTHVNKPNQRDRRHGYADLLRYPKSYDMQWRIWSGGTARCLLWGDPAFVRRFARSARLYDGDSFEINEMLATKMLGEPYDAEPFDVLTAPYRFYDYEFERYWHYYQVWGRVSYNPETPDELWQHSFAQRFGERAGPHVMRGLHEASWVLPRIVASAYRYFHFPTTRGWAEMMHQEDLPTFATAEGSDIQQFQNFQDAARAALQGEPTTMRTPAATSRWFAERAEAILAAVAAAQAVQGDATDPEFITTVTDLNILAHLAQYYAERIPAAVYYSIFKQSEQPAALKTAMAYERKAIHAWQALVEAAGDVYNTNLAFGVESRGYPRHWRDELPKLNASLAKLEEAYGLAQSGDPKPGSTTIPDYMHAHQADAAPPTVHLERVASAPPLTALAVFAQVTDPDGVASVRLRYRHLTQFEDYQSLDMHPDSQNGLWSATISAPFLVPEWDLMYFVEVMDKQGNGHQFPDLDLEMPYVVVPLQR